MAFEPSQYQQKIFDFIKTGKGNGIINAVAGSGKTTTLVKSAAYLTGSAIFCAFNKHVQEELNRRFQIENIAGITASTIHSLGFKCVRNSLGDVKLEEFKYYDLLYEDKTIFRIAKLYKDMLEQRLRNAISRSKNNPNDMEEMDNILADLPSTSESVVPQVQAIMIELANLVRLTLTPFTKVDIAELVDHYNIGIDVTNEEEFDLFFTEVIDLIKKGNIVAEKSHVIDYTDMLYLPHIFNLYPRYKFNWLFVDECQDLSMAQIQLILKHISPNGRFLCVGDPYQSIYGFAGADSESYDSVKKILNAKEFPLSISYRCPKEVVRLAKMICPGISSANDALEGTVIRQSYKELHTVVSNGDMILSRTTAPLITLCIELITKRIPAKVRGRDLAKMLTIIIREIAEMKNFRYEEFLDFTDQYKSARLKILGTSIKNRRKIDAIIDQIAGIDACYLGFSACADVDELCEKVENLFSDAISPVLLSTIHRAKGLETERVFILDYDQLPAQYPGQREWEIIQERNCHYVAITRAKQQLYQVYFENATASLQEKSK